MLSHSPKFCFGTKAETLERIAPLINSSKVLDLCYFRVNEWTENRSPIVTMIQRRFRGASLIVRSSAISEDSDRNSMAGAFATRLGIDGMNAPALEQAVDQVIVSYNGNNSGQDQVLIQPMLLDVALSGVIMTHHLEDGSPYYVVNYDDESSKTDSITGGNGVNKTVFIYREADPAYVTSVRMNSILRMAKELEEICGPIPLDIEFGMKRSGELYLFQVRRISVQKNWNVTVASEVSSQLPWIRNLVEQVSAPRVGIYGKRTILGTMPDWNPAEMIGSLPQVLAASLYRDLITRSTWREARGQMGYRKLPAEELMTLIGGRPYIDVRNSFNSFLPDGLDDSISNTMVDAWLDRLEDRPEYHDKIEFEVAQTCLDFTFEEKHAERYGGLLSHEGLRDYRNRLLDLTRKVLIMGNEGTLRSACRAIDSLAEFQRNRPLPKAADPGGHLALVKARDLLLECRALGTLPFSIIARHAFIAESFLRSAMGRGALSHERLVVFKRSVQTVSGFLASDLKAVNSGKQEPTEFMLRYGHLRPGTYDIKSLRYVDRDDLFRKSFETQDAPGDEAFCLAGNERDALGKLLKEAGLPQLTADDLLEYARTATAGREYSKFVFTRNLSDALEWLLRWGEGRGLSREHLANLDIEAVLGTLTNPQSEDSTRYFIELAEQGRRVNTQARVLKLSHLIRSARDLYVMPQHRSDPNFIGSRHISGPVVKIDSSTSGQIALHRKIACIENADPGFDWIFGREILGLITKYGGANSHMAIRCSEFGLPAAIGCGEQTFERIVRAGAVDLNCGERVLRPLHGN